jgi:hypothetical protein
VFRVLHNENQTGLGHAVYLAETQSELQSCLHSHINESGIGMPCRMHGRK